MVTVFAHRGAESIAPENTPAAFKTALDYGAKAIELDVQLTKDNVPVVVHDFVLSRYNKNATLPINQYTVEELKSIDVGRYFDDSFAGATIPTLKNVLSSFPNDVLINIEIKNSPVQHKGIETQIAELISAHHDIDNTIVSSFDHGALKRIAECNPDIKLGFLIHFPLIDAGQYVRSTGLNAVSVHPYKKIVDADFIAECHKHNLKVYPYTVTTKEDHERLTELGVDGFFTSLHELY